MVDFLHLKTVFLHFLHIFINSMAMLLLQLSNQDIYLNSMKLDSMKTVFLSVWMVKKSYQLFVYLGKVYTYSSHSLFQKQFFFFCFTFCFKNSKIQKLKKEFIRYLKTHLFFLPIHMHIHISALYPHIYSVSIFFFCPGKYTENLLVGDDSGVFHLLNATSTRTRTLESGKGSYI